jgi:hypothetical protein
MNVKKNNKFQKEWHNTTKSLKKVMRTSKDFNEKNIVIKNFTEFNEAKRFLSKSLQGLKLSKQN